METLESTFLRISSNPQLFEEMYFNDLKIQKDDVQADMLEQPSLYMKWARLSVIAETYFDQQKYLIDLEIRPAAQAAARELLQAAGEKITIDRLNEETNRIQSYKEAMQERLRLEGIMSTLKKVEFAMSQRCSMLQSYNSRQKAEMSFYSPDRMTKEI
jgi:hypothetical protein